MAKKRSNNKNKRQNKYSVTDLEYQMLPVLVQEKHKEFINNSVSGQKFVVQNVAEDNACFFRSVANGLFHMTDAPGTSGGDIFYSIGNWKESPTATQTKSNREWGYCGSQQTYLARKLQQIARQWILKNANETVTHIPEYQVVDLVRLIHGINFTDNDTVMAFYDLCYSKFAGDERKKLKLVKKTELDEDDMEITSIDVIDESDSEDDFMDYDEEDEYLSELTELKSDGTVTKHEMLKEHIRQNFDIDLYWDRWGSGVEAYALSKFLKVPIKVYSANQFNFSTNGIENGRIYQNKKPDKNVRFQLLQVWGEEFQDSAPPIELLYKKVKTKNNQHIEHYMALYRK